jgi:invasion protein IalB
MRRNSEAGLPALTRAAAIGVALLATVAPAIGQETPLSVYGDWQLRCGLLPDGGGQCAASQRVAAEDRGDVWLDAYLFRPEEDRSRLILSVLVPLQVILTKQLGIRIGAATDVDWFDFRSCSEEGCVAPIEIDGPMATAMRAGDEALFIFFFEEDVGVGVPVSLSGLSDVLDALP